jgi:hypothetical protein
MDAPLSATFNVFCVPVKIVKTDNPELVTATEFTPLPLNIRLSRDAPEALTLLFADPVSIKSSKTIPEKLAIFWPAPPIVTFSKRSPPETTVLELFDADELIEIPSPPNEPPLISNVLSSTFNA